MPEKLSESREELSKGLLPAWHINMNNKDQSLELGRRDFLKGSSLSALMMMMGGVPLRAQNKPAAEPAANAPTVTVNCGVIGCGVWGREILQTLARIPSAVVLGICDHYAPMLRRSQEAAPKAQKFTDYKELLANKDIHAVIVATPTHQHREVVLAALQAGKSVYCEAPLGHTIEEARVIAQAAKAAKKVNFQAGLQFRSDPQRHFLLGFIRSGAMGRTLFGRSQWHKKVSWRQVAGNPERETEANWRLRKDVSTGLLGEIGLHQIDAASWFFLAKPVAVSAFGSVMHWTDGREIPDTVQAVYEYPTGIQFSYDCTLANSFDGDYEMYHGSDSAIMVRQSKAWMFKEVDAPLLGWEVFARKDGFYKETGIALVANASKLSAQGDSEPPPFTNTPLSFALEAFLTNSDLIKTGVDEFASSFDINDTAALEKYIADIAKAKLPAAGYKEGYESVVSAIKGQEAMATRQRVTIPKELYDI